MNEDWTGHDPFGLPDTGDLHDPGHLDPTGLDEHLDAGYHDPPENHDSPYHHDLPEPDAPGPHPDADVKLTAGSDAEPAPESGDVAPLPEHDPATGLESGPAEHHEPFDQPDYPDQASLPDHPDALLDHLDTLPQHPDISPFPPQFEVDVVPSDGLAWVDPHLLGGPEPAAGPGGTAAAALHDLRAVEGADPAQSDDPAIRALAQFWGD